MQQYWIRDSDIPFKDKLACADAKNRITKFVNTQTLDRLEDQTFSLIEVTNENEDNFWSYNEKLIHLNKAKQSVNLDPNKMPELRYYLNQDPLKMTDNVAKYWREASESLLKDLAIKSLTLIVTSVPAERLFSKAGRIISEDRNRLSGKHLSQLLFLSTLDKNYWNLE